MRSLVLCALFCSVPSVSWGQEMSITIDREALNQTLKEQQARAYMPYTILHAEYEKGFTFSASVRTETFAQLNPLGVHDEQLFELQAHSSTIERSRTQYSLKVLVPIMKSEKELPMLFVTQQSNNPYALQERKAKIQYSVGVVHRLNFPLF